MINSWCFLARHRTLELFPIYVKSQRKVDEDGIPIYIVHSNDQRQIFWPRASPSRSLKLLCCSSWILLDKWFYCLISSSFDVFWCLLMSFDVFWYLLISFWCTLMYFDRHWIYFFEFFVARGQALNLQFRLLKIRPFYSLKKPVNLLSG